MPSSLAQICILGVLSPKRHNNLTDSLREPLELWDSTGHICPLVSNSCLDKLGCCSENWLR